MNQGYGRFRLKYVITYLGLLALESILNQPQRQDVGCSTDGWNVVESSEVLGAGKYLILLRVLNRWLVHIHILRSALLLLGIFHPLSFRSLRPSGEELVEDPYAAVATWRRESSDDTQN